VRTPFAVSGGAFADLMAVDLARAALKGLVTKTALDPARVDYVCLGTVIQEGERAAPAVLLHAGAACADGTRGGGAGRP
jgi:acetyl-CoA C-acetyltransferase